MTEQGIVRKVEGEFVKISGDDCTGCDRGAHCGSCGPAVAGSENHGAGGHGELSLFGAGRERSFTVRNSQAFDLAPGDRVEYFIAPGKAIKAGFFVLMLPILVFFLFYFLTGVIWTGAGETAKVLAGVGGILLGFLMIFVLKKKIGEFPEITKVVSAKR
jgi:positive regulator of sigma E activity